jgi:glutathione synthase
VVNNPASLRTVNEKLLPLQFPQFAPPTLVTSDLDRVAAFAAQHGRTILKPLDDCSGRGIRIVAAGAPIPQEWAGQFLMVQRFIPEVAEGDKRILVLDGEILGAVNRIPRGPDALANIHQGARVVATTITPRDREIVTAITPLLRERGLWLAGIDVIGGYLTEINVTSPSAARQINTVSGTQIEKPVVDFLEAMARHRQVQRG